MGKKEDLRAAKQAAKAKLSPKPKDQQARDRARAAQRASKPPPKAKDRQAQDHARASAHRNRHQRPKISDETVLAPLSALKTWNNSWLRPFQHHPLPHLQSPQLQRQRRRPRPSLRRGNRATWLNVTFPATRPALLSFSRLESLQLILPRCGSMTRLTPSPVNRSRFY